MNIIQKAYQFASTVHQNEFRRDNVTPYMEHVIKVADIVTARGGGENEIVTAILHDTLESGATVEQLIEQGFSQEVIDAVKLLTLDKDKSYMENIRFLKTNEIARSVKIADNLANLSDSPTDKQIFKYAKSLKILMEEKF